MHIARDSLHVALYSQLVIERLFSSNLNHLLVLAVLLEEANVTRAAKRLGLTQSATSHSLGVLRREFSDELLIRTGHGMRLTEEAERLRPELDRLLNELASVIDVRKDFEPKLSTRTFTVATADFLVAPLGRELAFQFERRAPLAGLRLEQLQAARLVEQLTSRATDLALGPLIHLGAEITSEPIAEEPYVTALSAEHPLCAKLRGKRELPLDEFLRLRHGLISPSKRHESDVDRKLREAGERRNVAVRFESFLAAAQALVGSAWVLTAPRRVFSGLGRKVRLFSPPVDLQPLRFALHFETTRAQSPDLLWLKKQVKASLSKM